jgi:hypothetical protein
LELRSCVCNNARSATGSPPSKIVDGAGALRATNPRPRVATTTGAGVDAVAKLKEAPAAGEPAEREADKLGAGGACCMACPVAGAT